MNKNQKRIIVIGGSAGALPALIRIIESLETSQTSVFVALHGGGNQSPNILEKKLPKKDSLKIAMAEDGEPVAPGRLYIAQSDHHLMIQGDSVQVGHGPRVNRSRPAIDLLFRSAAVAYGTRTIGVLLSGLLSDGTAGLMAIKRCGGITVAQDPADALFGDMPRSAMEAMEPNEIKPAAEIGELLNRLVASPVKNNGKVPEEILMENRFDLNKKSDISEMDELGDKVSLSCPECGGPLWKMNGEGPGRYRCHSGHSLNNQSLLDGQDEEIENTLRVALRTLEEKERVQENLVKAGKSGGRKNSENILQKRMDETKSHIDRLRKLILGM